MWSHYSNGHRGVCLGFSVADTSIFSDARPIEYSDEYPLIKYFAMAPEQRVSKMLLTKSRHWRYEQEWRVFRTDGPGLAICPAGTLVRVVLGCGIRPSDRDEIVALAVGLPHVPEIYQAMRSPSKFALELLNVDNRMPPSNKRMEPTRAGA